MDLTADTVVSSTYVAILEHGVTILFVIVAALIVQYASSRFIERVIRKLVPRGRGTAEAEYKRENTLISVFNSTSNVLIWLVVTLTILSELGVAIAPILAAAGIAGIALGFGGQYLIRDVISGLFILLENQYRVGDVVCFDGTCGLVENVSLRMTTLRDLNATVHHIPHGEIKKVSNLTKGYSRVELNIGVSYKSDLAHVKSVINQVGAELAADPAWKEQIIKAPAFLRLDNFGESAIIVKILGDTATLKQWDVAGELRWRLKLAFDKEGIEIPYPQRVTHQAK